MNAFSRTILSACACLALTGPSALAQGDLLLREVVSREHTIDIGGVETTPVKELSSREFSFYVEQGRADIAEISSREYDVLVNSSATPPQVTETIVSVSPTGDSATLDWSGYNQWAVADVLRFDIYFSDAGPFTNVTGMTPFLVVGGGGTSLAIDGLTPYQDHYFAVVAVDGLGQFNPAVSYSAAYVLSPEVVSREHSIFIGNDTTPDFKEVISREYDIAVVNPAPPPAVVEMTVTASASGDAATLQWPGYNQWVVGDILRFDIYLSDAGAFSNVTGMTPYTSVGGDNTSVTLSGLTPGRDHFFAIVAVDALGHFEPVVSYSAAYVLSPEVISREHTIFVGNETAPAYQELVSREFSIVVPDSAVPAPVTGIDSGFTVETSRNAFGAVELAWPNYNELAQGDVSRYRVYVGPTFFTSVVGREPFAFVQSGQQRFTLTGLSGLSIAHFAVVAEDALGNFNPTVRSVSGQSSISGVGEVSNLAVVSGLTSLSFSWQRPADTDPFLAGYRVSFRGDTINLSATATSWEALSLELAHGYPFRLSTVDTFGNVSAGVLLLAATWLPNPANVGLTSQGGDVLLFWDAAQPSSLVNYYAIYRSNSPISSIAGLSPFATTDSTNQVLGTFAQVANQHFAVAAVNISNGVNPVVTSLQANKASQSISFPALTAGPLEIPLLATASSGLPLRFEASPNHVAATNGSLLQVHQGGSVTVTAVQDGSASFWPASASQSLRLPPVIGSLTANGAELLDGATLTRDTTLAVEARDADGMQSAAFYRRKLGETSWTLLQLDSLPGNGLSAILSAGALSDGVYDIRVVVTSTTGVTSERIRRVNLALQSVLAITLANELEEGVGINGTLSITQCH